MCLQTLKLKLRVSTLTSKSLFHFIANVLEYRDKTICPSVRKDEQINKYWSEWGQVSVNYIYSVAFQTMDKKPHEGFLDNTQPLAYSSLDTALIFCVETLI